MPVLVGISAIADESDEGSYGEAYNDSDGDADSWRARILWNADHLNTPFNVFSSDCDQHQPYWMEHHLAFLSPAALSRCHRPDWSGKQDRP